MPKDYTPEELQKLCRKLPEELQEAIFSVETADHIWDVCERYDIDKISTVAKRVGNVLVGVLPPDELQETLEKELEIDSETAKKITRDINRFIFYPVKPFLEKLYSVGITSANEQEKTEKESDAEDKYREPIK